MSLQSNGLSPRVRGNLGCPLGVGGPDGSIPACAGEPPSASGAGVTTAVYPRVCGGTTGFNQSGQDNDGLSPRVRGNQAPDAIGLAPFRSIPACAGEPARQKTSLESSTVYPRVCGGTSMDLIPARSPGGLSPRVRGNRPRDANPRLWQGSIPACAGEPVGGETPSAAAAVYPRVCGGTQSPRSGTGQRHGLSPRVRGNPAVALVSCR